MAARYVPDRGDVVWLEFDPQAGHEQAAIARQSSFPRAATIKNQAWLCSAITSRSKGYPFEVNLPAGLPVQGAVLCDQVKSLDWAARRSRLATEIPSVVLEDVLAKVRALLR